VLLKPLGHLSFIRLNTAKSSSKAGLSKQPKSLTGKSGQAFQISPSMARMNNFLGCFQAHLHAAYSGTLVVKLFNGRQR
jgi:hypothetical protein